MMLKAATIAALCVSVSIASGRSHAPQTQSHKPQIEI